MRLASLAIVPVLAVLALGSAPAHAEAQEAFICKMKAGHDVEDLMKVAADFAAAAPKIAGGKNYKARVLVPIASQDLATVIWIGTMPSFSAMAAFADAYNASEAGQELNEKFEAVSTCESHSYWQVLPVM